MAAAPVFDVKDGRAEAGTSEVRAQRVEGAQVKAIGERVVERATVVHPEVNARIEPDAVEGALLPEIGEALVSVLANERAAQLASSEELEHQHAVIVETRRSVREVVVKRGVVEERPAEVHRGDDIEGAARARAHIAGHQLDALGVFVERIEMSFRVRQHLRIEIDREGLAIVVALDPRGGEACRAREILAQGERHAAYGAPDEALDELDVEPGALDGELVEPMPIDQTRKIVAPQVNPEPKTVERTRSPFLTFPSLRQ